MFNVFRRSDSGYWCYQEPLNEQLIHITDKPARILEFDVEKQSYLRHPVLENPYFYEFHALAKKMGTVFRKEFSYDQYFTTTNTDIADLKAYFSILIEGAKGRPVFQCCRTAGRVAQLQSMYPGAHIYLLRNPWDQWWSYKKDAYFDSANLLIANARKLPKFFEFINEEIKISYFHDQSVSREFEYFNEHRLNSANSYKLFYALWCHAIIEAKSRCELSINIDKLSISTIYRDEVLEGLKLLGIEGLDFSDCSMPMANYGESDGNFFFNIESQVHESLLAHGYGEQQVIELQQLSDARNQSLVDTSSPKNFAIRDAMRAREYFLQSETDLVKIQRVLLTVRAQAEHAETTAGQAEAKVQIGQLEAKAAVEQAAATVRQAEGEARIQQSELNATLDRAEAKAEKAEAAVQQAEARAKAQKGEFKAQQAEAELRVQQKEARTKLLHAEARIEQQAELGVATQKIEELNQSNHHWWSMVDQQVRRLESSEVKIAELNELSHHVWLEKERITKELQNVYASKSWCFTWPLRKLMQLACWLLGLPGILLFWSVSLPKRLARWLLVPFMDYALKHPRLRTGAMVWLSNHPNLQVRLRSLALALARGGKLLNHAAPRGADLNTQKFLSINVSKTRRKCVSDLPIGIKSLSPPARAICLELLDIQANQKNREIK